MSAPPRMLTVAVLVLGLSLSGEGYPRAPDLWNQNRIGLWVDLPQDESPSLADRPMFTQEEIDAQSEALARIPNVEVTFAPNQVPREILGLIGFLPGEPTQVDLDQLMESLGPIFLAVGTETLKLDRINEYPERNSRTIKLRQEIRGRDVRSAMLVLDVEASTGQITRIGGTFLPDRGMPTEARLQQEDVVPAVLAAIEEAGYVVSNFQALSPPELIYKMDRDRRGYLLWQVAVQYDVDDLAEPARQNVYVDAVTGEVWRTDPLGVVGGLPRGIYGREYAWNARHVVGR